MATAAAGKLEKKKEEQDFRQIINDLLNQAMASKGGFKPEVVQQYEVAGRKSLEEKEKQQRLESVPSRPIGKIVVSKNEVPKNEKRGLSPIMTESAIEKAMGLGEKMELAALEGKKISFRGWVTGG